ncbi:MAG: hypothetical protein B6241_07610 [Spirochaetaceae bacterium 4572_59]|nr:MAG: hypothetical protein B6241_07610 [Spirochaetaceae bacterium 4572_59]
MKRQTCRIKYLIFVSIFSVLALLPISLSAEEDTLSEVPTVKLTPIFPDSEEGLIYIEGEDAVSTNFSTTAVYNYGASNYRSLQLIQQNAPYGGQAYYAEYAFYVEESGDYYFWYGGTPPGPKEDVYPSYASPFRYILDDQLPVSVYRENLAINEAYTPAYYWMEVEKLSLTAGIHKLRIEVADKRRFDGKYYFFMDAFFFLREDRMEEELTNVPDLFPEDRLDRSMDNPFQSVSYYENIIAENPANKNAYIILSMIYSLLGDYINAIKNLNSAVNLDPEDPYPLLLMAKNRIWNAEVTAGLSLYKQLMIIAPDNVAYWAEAGKVAAWTGNYRDSIDFFTRGLEIFPEDLNLKVNLGLTYLWMSRRDDADRIFIEAEESVLGDHQRAMELGSIHSVNGYPANAVKIYNKEIGDSPEYLETYLSLEQAYRDTGENEKAADIIRGVYETFEESEEFSSYMTVYEQKVKMKADILASYRAALDENPDNISLRQELAQTYFWNGLRNEAVDESRRILVNKMYLLIKDFDSKANALLILNDKISYLKARYEEIAKAYSTASRELSAAQSSYSRTKASLEKKPENSELAEKFDDLSIVYSDAYNSAVLWRDRLAEQEIVLQDLSEQWETLSVSEEAEEKIFRQLMGDLDWSWDRDFTRMELREVQRSEPFLAGYVLGRLALFDNKKEEAIRYLNKDLFEDDPFARYGLYQAWLWQGNRAKQKSMWESEADILTLYRQHLSDMEASAWDDGASDSYFIPAEDDTEILSKTISERSKVFHDDIEGMENMADEIESALDRKLNRQIYALEQESYLLRYELGNYYLDMNENLRASRQFDRVLAMDPWNISANYKLGIVSQRYGNWSRAMDQYKKVYFQNPLYENAAHYYNQLARENADTVHVTAQNITDPAVISYTGRGEYQSSINNRLAWGAFYNLDINRQYRSYGTEEPSSYKLHTAAFKLPLSFPAWNLLLTPFAGGQSSNAFFSGDYTFNPDEAVQISENNTATTVEPYGGLGVGWTCNFLNTYLEYRYELEEDSLYAGRSLTKRHAFDLTANSYFPIEDNYLFGPVTTRTFGSFNLQKTEGESDTNQVYQILQEVTAGYVVSQKPYIKLTATGLFNFENSRDSNPSYYAPDEIMEARGGLKVAWSTHNPEYTESLEVSLFGSAGGYWSGTMNYPAVKTEGLFSVFYVKDAMMLYLTMGGAGSYKDGLSSDPFYWELSGTLGCKINVASLLIP